MAKPVPVVVLDINELFSLSPVYQVFSSKPPIPTQLKNILKENPDYEVQYLKQVNPKPDVGRMMLAMGLPMKLRGRGFTRSVPGESKKRRKMSQASRKRNRK